MHLPKHAVNCPINMVNLQQINIYEGKKKNEDTTCWSLPLHDFVWLKHAAC